MLWSSFPVVFPSTLLHFLFVAFETLISHLYNLVELYIELLSSKIFKAIFISEDRKIKVFYLKSIVSYIIKIGLSEFVYVCTSVFLYVHSCVNLGALVPQWVWKSDENLERQSLPYPSLKIGSLCCFSTACITLAGPGDYRIIKWI